MIDNIFSDRLEKTVYTFVFLILCLSLTGQNDLNIIKLAHIVQPAKCNDVWGYVDGNGLEYAVVGNRIDTRIYSLAVPDDPKLEKIIVGPPSVWRDFKSFENFIFIVADQGQGGLRIVDMTLAPDSIGVSEWTPMIRTDGIDQTLEHCHNLYIDPRGIAYLAGCNTGIGGILIVDVHTDPFNPILLGIENEAYAHDVITRGDTLFASEIFEGNLGIYDISQKDSVLLLSRTLTSSRFTHNAWPSDDGKYIFTTDERTNAFVDAYDIRDIQNPSLIDSYRPVAEGEIVPHNVHYYSGYLVTSWYTEGLLLIDAGRPDNLIRVGQYDTSPENGNGCWGVYPYLPSGLILATDIDNGFFVLQPEYVRAAYLEGVILDMDTNQPIEGAQITLNDEALTTEISNDSGVFKTGISQSRPVEITVSHLEYTTESIFVNLINGQVTEVEIRLEQLIKHSVTGRVTNSQGEAISKVIIQAMSNQILLETETLEDGTFQFSAISGSYEIFAGQWGYKGVEKEMILNADMEINFVLEAGYEDDFVVDLGWTVNSSASSGFWTRVIPEPTFFEGSPANPDLDIDGDIGLACYVTGNDNSSVSADDVDNGATVLLSPMIDLSAYANPVIIFRAWFYNGGGDGMPNDTMKLFLISGKEKLLVSTISDALGTGGRWRPDSTIQIRNFLMSADFVQFQVEVADDIQNGHIVEGGIDGFKVIEGETTTSVDDTEIIGLVIFPNPASHQISLKTSGNIDNILSIYAIDTQGRYHDLYNTKNGVIDVSDLLAGFYFLQINFLKGKPYLRPFVKI